MALTRDGVNQVFKLIVQLWPYGDLRLDTYALVDNGADLESNNLGKSYDHYLAGTFWSREWVEQGADENTLAKHYPMLVTEQKRVSKKSVFDKEACWDWWLNFMAIRDCEGCDKKYTDDELDSMLQQMALDFVDYLDLILVAEVTVAGETQKMIGTSELLDSLEEAGHIESWRELYEASRDLKDTGIELTPSRLGNSDGARIVVLRLTFCNCPAKPAPLELIGDTKVLGSTKCTTC